MAEDVRVETIYEIVDKASAPMRKIAAQSKMLEAAAVKSKQAVAEIATKGAAVAAAADQKAVSTGAMKAAKEYEKSAKESGKGSRNLARRRLIAHHQAMRPTIAASQIASGGLNAIGLSSTEVGGKLMKMGHLAFIAGDELSKLGGTAGKIGHKLGKIGAASGALIASFEMGYALGDKINNWINAADDARTALNNEIAVRGVGYKSVAAYTFVVDKAGVEQRKLAKEAKKLAELMPTMPISGTAEEMEKWRLKLRKQIGMGTGLTDKQKALIKVIEETKNQGYAGAAVAKQHRKELKRSMAASKKLTDEKMKALAGLAEEEARVTTGGLKKSAMAEMDRNRVLAAQAKERGAMPQDASREVQEKQVAWAVQLAEQAEQTGRLFGLNKEAYRDELLARAGLIETMENYRAASLEQSNYSHDMAEAVKREVDFLKKNPLFKKLKEGSDEAAAMILAAGIRAAGEMGAAGDPKVAEEARQKIKAATYKKTKTNFDFRNSRFNIEQKFAEGFDPDRIAVAFAGDLATLGERKLQSNQAPALSGMTG